MDAKPTSSETIIVEKPHLEPTSAVTSHRVPITSHRVPITSHYRKPVLLKMLARETDLSMAEVQRVLNHLNIIVRRHLVHGAVGHFTLPGLFKVKIRKQHSSTTSPLNPLQPLRKAYEPDCSEPYILEFHPAKALKDSIHASAESAVPK